MENDGGGSSQRVRRLETLNGDPAELTGFIGHNPGTLAESPQLVRAT